MIAFRHRTAATGRPPEPGAPPFRLRDRIAARVNAFRLDQQLADGVPPDATGAHALRAHRLIGAGERTALAHQLAAVIDDARDHGSRLSGVHPRRLEVLDAAAELRALAARLAAGGPVAPEGVARVSLLLGDGTGPLYSDVAPERLAVVAERATAALELDRAA